VSVANQANWRFSQRQGKVFFVIGRYRVIENETIFPASADEIGCWRCVPSSEEFNPQDADCGILFGLSPDGPAPQASV
jgi:hypothetical protein